MLFCRVAVKSKTAALQHRNTKNDASPLTNHDFDIRLSVVGRNLDIGIVKWGLGFLGSEICYFGIHLLSNRAIKSGDPLSDHSLLINDEGGRNGSDSIVPRHLFGSHHDRVGDVHGLGKVANDCCIPFIQTDPNHLKSVFSIGLIELNEVGYGFATGSTPGCPEVEENNFSLEIGKSNLLIIEGFESEIRGQTWRGFLFFSTMGKKE